MAYFVQLDSEQNVMRDYIAKEAQHRQDSSTTWLLSDSSAWYGGIARKSVRWARTSPVGADLDRCTLKRGADSAGPRPGWRIVS